MVRGGTYFVGETLRFGAADSGNTWSSYGNEDVVLSGGIDLSGLKWSKSATNPQALEATLPAHYAAAAGAAAGAAAATIKTLFVDGVREVRAKYPNGDPLNPGSAGGYAANAAGAAGGQYSSNGDQFPDTVTVKSAGGVVLSQGSSVGNVPMTFTEAEPESNLNPTRYNFFAYQNHSAERFNNTFNHPFWNSQVSPGFKVGDSFAKGSKNWATPSTGVVHMYHSGGWGGWQFQVAERPDPDTIIFGCTRLSDGTQVACPERNVPGPDEVVIKGGYQECRGAYIGKNSFYVENIEEELDVPREWFAKEQTLMYIPRNGTDVTNPATKVVGAVLKQVIEVKGATGLSLRGFGITHTAPTYMDSYECPSGGDWAIHRGAAVFIEDSAQITVEGFAFDQVSGNAIMFSNAVSNSTIRQCTFDAVGDSAIAMVGSSQLMVGTKGKGLMPTNNLIEKNIVDTVGVYGKQTSAYFKAKSDSNLVRNNVFMNGPRAGVNFNDGTAGGEVLERNLVFNFVRESGDHGMYVACTQQQQQQQQLHLYMFVLQMLAVVPAKMLCLYLCYPISIFLGKSIYIYCRFSFFFLVRAECLLWTRNITFYYLMTSYILLNFNPKTKPRNPKPKTQTTNTGLTVGIGSQSFTTTMKATLP